MADRPCILVVEDDRDTADMLKAYFEAQGYEIEEHVIPREMLYLSDEVFFTGTASEVTPIRSIDQIKIGDGRHLHPGQRSDQPRRRERRPFSVRDRTLPGVLEPPRG